MSVKIIVKVLVLLFVIVMMALGSAYLIQTKNRRHLTIQKELDRPETPNIDIPLEKWERREDEERKIGFDYPANWKVEAGDTIVIAKGEYRVEIKESGGSADSTCVFDSEDLTHKEGYLKFVNFKEISAGENIYRRPITPEIVKEEGVSTGLWNICKKREDGVFTTESGFGEVSYKGPLNSDPTMLGIMDRILGTIEKLEL